MYFPEVITYLLFTLIWKNNLEEVTYVRIRSMIQTEKKMHVPFVGGVKVTW
jgi:hypothetical protein